MASPTRSVFSYPSDELARLATLSLVTGTVDGAYVLANLVGDNPGFPFRANEVAIDILIDHGSAKVVELVSLIHTNLRSPATVLFQTHTTTDFSSPDTSESITLTAPDADNLLDNPILYRDGAAAKRYNRLHITGNPDAVIM